MNFWFTSCILLFVFFVAHAYSEEISGVSLILTSEEVQEVSLGEILYIAALIKNSSDAELKGKVEVVLPDEWQLVAGNREVIVAPQNSHLLILSIKVSNQALAGEYPLQIGINGDISQKCYLKAIVRSKSGFSVAVNDLQKFYAIDEPIELSLACTNEGNTALNLRFEARADPICKLIYHSKTFQIPPYGTEKLSLCLGARFDCKDDQQFVLYKVFNEDTGEQIYQNTISLRLNPLCDYEDDPYIRIPGYLSMIALGDNDKYVMALECAGEGIIDPLRERYLEYFFCLPSDSRNVIYSVDQRLFVGIGEPDWDVNIGDTVYELTPLTQNYRYGRGVGFDIDKERWAAGIHYTQNVINNDYNPKELCGYMGYTPLPQWRLTGSYLYKVLQHTPSSNIVSIRSEAEFPANIYTDLEIAKDFIKDFWDGSTMAYHFRAHGRCFKDVWFDIDKIYAGSDFYGYYQYLHNFSSSIDFPLGKSIRCNLNVNRLRQNYDIYQYTDLYNVSPRQHQYSAYLTYKVSNNATLGLNGLLFRGQDVTLTPQYNFYQKWAGLTLFLTLDRYFFNYIISFGQQKNYLTNRTTHFLQTYNIFIGKEFSPALSATLFYDGGNTNYYDARPWRTSFGASLTYRYSSRGNFAFFAQKVKKTPDKYELSQISFNLNHTFKNGHDLYISAQYFHYKTHYPNDALFLVSYTIPFSTPVGERTDIGSLDGYVYDVWRECPIPQAIVNCNGTQASTDSEGYFTLPYMPVGDKALKIDVLPADLIPLQVDLQMVELNSGTSNQAIIPVIPAGTLKGQIKLYRHEELVEYLGDTLEEAQQRKLIDLGGIEGIRVILSNEKEAYVSTTNSKGQYQFPKVRPGQWNLVVATDSVLDLHELDMNDLIIDIMPGEKKEISFRALPLPINIKKVE
jgi:hypothetical protein